MLARRQRWDPVHPVAQQLGVLKGGSGWVNVSQAVREFRNLIHPGNQWQRKTAVGSEDAAVALNAVRRFIRDFATG